MAEYITFSIENTAYEKSAVAVERVFVGAKESNAVSVGPFAEAVKAGGECGKRFDKIVTRQVTVVSFVLFATSAELLSQKYVK